mmetsp:Transcript_15351/g.61753  ORF Transcript_15351/g.61753 Transcript_15351/m.61753 type:complete len:237 (-) Transcript_15351:1190-1900(-)
MAEEVDAAEAFEEARVGDEVGEGDDDGVRLAAQAALRGVDRGPVELPKEGRDAGRERAREARHAVDDGILLLVGASSPSASPGRRRRRRRLGSWRRQCHHHIAHGRRDGRAVAPAPRRRRCVVVVAHEHRAPPREPGRRDEQGPLQGQEARRDPVVEGLPPLRLRADRSLARAPPRAPPPSHADHPIVGSTQCRGVARRPPPLVAAGLSYPVGWRIPQSPRPQIPESLPQFEETYS